MKGERNGCLSPIYVKSCCDTLVHWLTFFPFPVFSSLLSISKPQRRVSSSGCSPLGSFVACIKSLSRVHWERKFVSNMWEGEGGCIFDLQRSIWDWLSPPHICSSLGFSSRFIREKLCRRRSMPTMPIINPLIVANETWGTFPVWKVMQASFPSSPFSFRVNSNTFFRRSTNRLLFSISSPRKEWMTIRIRCSL